MAEPLELADDGVLVAEHLGGRRDASEALFRRFQPRLLRYCRRITDPALAEDLAQETMCRALAHLPAFDTRRPLWPWLKTIAVHLAIDTAEKRSWEVVETPKRESVHWDRHAATEERPLLAEAMRALTQAQRTALWLRYVEGWRSEELAEALALSGPALKQLLFRARERLRMEYTRLTEASLAIAVAPLRWIRRLLEAEAEKLKRALAKIAPYSGPGTDGGFQLAAGVAAAVLLFGADSAPALPGGDTRPPAALPNEVRTSQDIALGAPESGAPDASVAGTWGSAASDAATGARKEQRVPADEAAGDKAQETTDPNRNTQQPEDTRVLSVSGSSSSPSDNGTLFALGRGACNNALCYPVLFRSADGGSSWKRLPGEGLAGDGLLLPPGYPSADARLFASGQEGLLVSEDGGASFHPAAAGGGPHAAGSAAISPAFHSGDPTILIGGRSLLRYRDDTKTVEPAAMSAPPGRLEPAYSPAFEEDRTVFLGGAMGPSTVYRCVGGACSGTTLQGQEELVPKLRVAPDFGETGRVYAFTQWAVFRSGDRGATFDPIPIGWSGEVLSDLTVTADLLIAATTPNGQSGSGGAYLSMDEGSSWARLQSPLLGAGVRTVAVAGDRMIAALYDRGLACSSDRGLTWAPRCRS